MRPCLAASSSYEVLAGPPLTGATAAAFAEDLAALPAWEMSRSCRVTSVPVEPWALQVETSDGSTAYLGSPMRLCASVDVDGADLGVDAVLAAFLGNQARQQSGIPELGCPPPDQVGRLGRLAEGAPTWNASFDPSTAVAGVVCYRADPMGEREYGDDSWGIAATLSPVHGQLEAVRDDLAANRAATGDDGMCTDTGPQRMVLLEDADGDQAAWVDDRCTGEFAGPGGSWTPGPAAEQSIDEALRGR